MMGKAKKKDEGLIDSQSRSQSGEFGTLADGEITRGITGMEKLILSRALNSLPGDEEMVQYARTVVGAAMDDILVGDVDMLTKTQAALESVRKAAGDEGAPVVALLRDKVHAAVVSIGRSFGTRMVRLPVRRPEQVEEQEEKAAVKKAEVEAEKSE